MVTPEEKAVIQAAVAFVYGGPSQIPPLAKAVEALDPDKSYAPGSPPFKVCGQKSPTGTMTCVLREGHVLVGWDTSRYRFHQGFAANKSRRSWREDVR